MDIVGADSAMMCAGVMFGWVIPQVFVAGVVTNVEDFLCLVAHQPKISHVHCPRPLTFDGVGDDAHCGRIVAVDRGRRLWVAHFFQGES